MNTILKRSLPAAVTLLMFAGTFVISAMIFGFSGVTSGLHGNKILITQILFESPAFIAILLSGVLFKLTKRNLIFLTLFISACLGVYAAVDPESVHWYFYFISLNLFIWGFAPLFGGLLAAFLYHRIHTAEQGAAAAP